MMNRVKGCIFLIVVVFSSLSYADLRGTGDLGLIIEREAGRVMLIETSRRTMLKEVNDMGDLSHASVVFSRDARYAFVFGRDGGLTKVDLLEGKISERIIQAGNSIGGAISQDGRLVAVSNYEPGGVKVFNSESLELLADIPAEYGNENQRSRVVGLVDAPGQRFVFSLFDAGEIWIADLSRHEKPAITKLKNAGKQPYDALITPGGRYYIAGLFGEDGLAVVDLWNPQKGISRVLDEYGRGVEKLPVYKMPHLEGWAVAGNYLLIPAIGQHAVLVLDTLTWKEIKRIPVHGQPVFVIARPDGRHAWINFALPKNDTVQIIDMASLEVVKELKPGKAILHMEFTPRGEEVWVSIRDDDKVKIYNTKSFEEVAHIDIDKPSGIFFSSRAHKIGL
jgi:protein NirF